MQSHPRAWKRPTRTAFVGIVALGATMLPAQAGWAADAQTVTVSTDRTTYLAAEGSRVAVGVSVTTSDGLALAAPITVDYATAGGTATPGSDYATASGALTFGAGTASGSAQRFTVNVRSDRTAETMETVALDLTSASGGATITPAARAIVINANGLPYLDDDLPIDRRVADLLARMTLEEKIGQMT